jgi:DNA-binding response OmpR family regulator
MSWLLKVTHMLVTFFNKKGRLLYSFHLCHILMDGINLAYYIKEKSPSTPVVLITGNGKDVSLSRIRDTAVDQALFKPFTLAEMEITVQGLLHP